MTLEEGLKSYLLADAGLTALIGSRLYPDDAIPQSNGTWPVLTYKQTGSDPQHFLDGGRSGVERDTFELAAHSPNRTACAAVRDRLRTILSGTAARGTWGGSGGIAVAGTLFTDVFADLTDPTDGSEKRSRALRATVVVIWNR